MSGIVCKVWNIKGSSSVNKQLNDSIGYILNDEKTAMLLASSFGEISDPKDQLMRECKYIENDIKTFSGALVCSQNLVSTDVKDAVSEMLDVKDFYEKKDGRIALHGVISLPIDESDTKNASVLMKLCQDVLKEIFPNNQAIMAVHTNTENLHIHFIVNSVGIDGKKIHQDKSFVRNVLQKCVNRNALKYGFTPNDKWSIQRDQELSEFALLKIEMREAIDIAIEKSSSFDDFVNEMKSMDYIVNAGKHISIKRPNDKKAIRTHRLGNNYTKDAIIERIQTRKDKFKEIDMDSSVPTWHKPDDIFTPTLSHMKKYKDMSNDEKKTALHEIRLGKNPWRENFRNNWQLNNIANELNLDNRILEYKRFYSTDGTVQGTLKGIVNAKKSLSSQSAPSHATPALIDSTNSSSSLVGLVSSNRRLNFPPYFCASPLFKIMLLACPICRYPLGSGGKRVCTWSYTPSARSLSISCSMKFLLSLSSFSSITSLIVSDPFLFLYPSISSYPCSKTALGTKKASRGLSFLTAI